MRVVFTGGGTGGHFYPLIATAEALRERAFQSGISQLDLYYFGPDPYDQKALEEQGIVFVSCPSGKMRRYRSILNFLDIFKVIGGVFVALFKLFVLYPDVVMSKGGFTSVPVVFAAWLLRIPILIHESDSKPGRANAFATRFARYIAISYKEAAEFFPQHKTALVGIPFRKIFQGERVGNPASVLGTTGTLPLVVVLGGSQGAERINDLVLESIEELTEKYEVFHQTGMLQETLVRETADNLLEKFPEKHARYHAKGFLDPLMLKAALSGASVIVSRAGSGAIYDIALYGIPAILIPIPEEISHDQRSNAYAYARTGAASVMEEKNLSQNLLVSEIDRIMSDPNLQITMKAAANAFVLRDGAEKIADTLIGIGREHE